MTQGAYTPKLVILSAPSGGGKTTLCQRLLRDFPVLTLSISSTTRAPRGSERDGVAYHFLTREQFERQIAEGRFAEWANVHGNYYGTSKDVIDRAFTAGQSVLLDIDVQGAESLRRAFPGRQFSVFIAPPSLEVLEQRLRARGTDSEETIRRRLSNAQHEMQDIDRFDYRIVNDDLDRAYQELRDTVERALGLSSGGLVV